MGRGSSLYPITRKNSFWKDPRLIWAEVWGRVGGLSDAGVLCGPLLEVPEELEALRPTKNSTFSFCEAFTQQIFCQFNFPATALVPGSFEVVNVSGVIVRCWEGRLWFPGGWILWGSPKKSPLIF